MSPPSMESPALNATLVERRNASDTHVIVKLRPDELPIRAFTPGQFLTVGLPLPARVRNAGKLELAAERTRLVKRAYSIASSPLDTGAYELFLAVVPGGRLTPELWKLSVGDRCWISPEALGSFTLDNVPRDADLVLVATGTGVAPYVSMLRTHSGDERWRRAALVHGACRADDLAYREEMEDLARRDASFAYVPLVSRETGACWSGLRGRVQLALEPPLFRERAGFDLDPAAVHAFLCGNPAMIHDVRNLLAARGFAAESRHGGNVHSERYW